MIGLVCKELEKQFVNMKKTIITTMKTPVGESVIVLLRVTTAVYWILSGDRLLRSREFLNEEDFYKSSKLLVSLYMKYVKMNWLM